MKPNGEFIMTEIDNEYVVVPVGETSGLKGFIRLNETGKDIWEGLTEGLTEEEIAEKLTEVYDVELSKALRCTRDVVEKLRGEGLTFSA